MFASDSCSAEAQVLDSYVERKAEERDAMSFRGMEHVWVRMICLILTATFWQGSLVAAQERVGVLNESNSSSPVPPADAGPKQGSLVDQSTVFSNVNIGEGDLLQVSLYGWPDFNAQVRVSSSGEISLPMIGQVEVRGLSPTQAEALISKRLETGGFFNNPQVSVLDRELATQGISVLGEVEKPGIYPILGPRKLFDLISAAGGTSPRAGNRILIARRANPQDVQTVILSDDPKKSLTANVDILPGDTVVVSKAGVVYVVGDVRLPGGFVMDKDKALTVLQALALAQGAGTYASLNHSKLIHRASDGVHETPIPLKKIIEGKAEDPKLQADDILFIPHNGSKEATSKGINSILQTVSGIAVYRF
jgi:polysaccharide export outer membrane protein